MTPERTHCWKRRWAVWYGPYRGGRSCQRAPVRRIHKTPSNTLRRSLQGRPRPSSRTASSGRMSSTICHCSLVKSIHNYYTVLEKVQETFCHTFLFMRWLVGKKKEYSICGFPPDCEPEWLYDMVWFRNDSSFYLREIGLVLESEWSRDPEQISYDFEKLLIAKSPIKVMVFQDFKGNSVPQLWSLLERGIRTFKTEPANEIYILAGLQNDEYEFAVKSIQA
jgi:hypothetical protein